MSLFTLEHGKMAYRADFVLYGIAIGVLAAYLLFDTGLNGYGFPVLASASFGLASWTMIEYVLHRFVLHGVQPFRGWHMQHHQRPKALICTPTILSASLIATLVFLPVVLLANLQLAAGLTLGVLTGYLAYTITHHATHHWHTDNAWLKHRKRWHAVHHHHIEHPGCFGVTSSFWDHVFGSIKR